MVALEDTAIKPFPPFERSDIILVGKEGTDR
jgi:hypothetical protein